MIKQITLAVVLSLMTQVVFPVTYDRPQHRIRDRDAKPPIVEVHRRENAQGIGGEPISGFYHIFLDTDL